MDRVRLSADELARLAEVEPVFVQRALQAGGLQQRETDGGFEVQDAARLRFLKAWDDAGLKVETIGNLIVRGELPFSFMDAPTMGVQPRLPSTYESSAPSGASTCPWCSGCMTLSASPHQAPPTTSAKTT